MNIAEILRSRRQQLNISQSDLAHHLGFKSRSSIYCLETGRSPWEFNKVIKACEILEMTLTIEKA